jgi:serine O-acetyltransferase
MCAQIGNGVLIGAGVSVLGNIKVGDGAKIGAGSVVLQDIGEHETAVGVPAKILKTRKLVGEASMIMDQTSFIDFVDYAI